MLRRIVLGVSAAAFLLSSAVIAFADVEGEGGTLPPCTDIDSAVISYSEGQLTLEQRFAGPCEPDTVSELRYELFVREDFNGLPEATINSEPEHGLNNDSSGVAGLLDSFGATEVELVDVKTAYEEDPIGNASLTHSVAIDDDDPAICISSSTTARPLTGWTTPDPTPTPTRRQKKRTPAPTPTPFVPQPIYGDAQNYDVAPSAGDCLRVVDDQIDAVLQQAGLSPARSYR